MPDCEMCGTFTAKSYNVDLRITSNFDREEEPFERYSIVCSDCRNKILNVFPKVEDEFFWKYNIITLNDLHLRFQDGYYNLW